MTNGPKPTSEEQALRIVEVLTEWGDRGWKVNLRGPTVYFTDPTYTTLKVMQQAHGKNAFDALCHATAIMGILLDTDKEKP